VTPTGSKILDEFARLLILQVLSSIEHRASSIEHRASSIEHRASSIEHRASSIEHRASSIHFPFYLIYIIFVTIRQLFLRKWSEYQMRIRYSGIFFLLFFVSNSIAFGQLTVTPCSMIGQTPQQFIQNQLVGQGVTISNAKFNGSSAVINSTQIGSFSATSVAYDELGLSGGILMTSGQATNAIGPNTGCGTASSDLSLPGDPDLNIVADTTTTDAAILEFDFVPVSDTLKFRYEFGSEEMYTFYMQYNDAFGFFLSGPGITGPFSNNSVNIALMPSTINSYVTINNLCNDFTSSWCNSPSSCPSGHIPPPSAYMNCTNPHGNGGFLQYNAFSWVFTAWHLVTPCQTYHIKIAIADAVDHQLDSGVFLEQNSFTSSGFTVNNTFEHPQLGQVAIEGCSDATVTFKLQSPALVNDTIHYTIGGTATNGIDYTTIPDSVVIPAGMDSVFLTIHPLMDNIAEGTEMIILDIPMLNCSGGTIYHDTIYILDNFTLTAFAGNDTSVCQGQSVTLHAQHAGGQAAYSYLWNTGSTLSQITVTPPIGNNVYYVDITDACSAIARDSVIVTVLAKPVVTNGNVISVVCTGNPTGIAPQSSIPNSTYSWTATCGNPNISGYSAGSGLTINQVLTNTGTTVDTVTYHVTAIAAGCTSSLVKDFKVAVIPSADAHFVPNGQSFCSGGNTNISILSNLSGTLFSWTYTLGSPNLSGALNGNGNSISQVLFNSGFTTDTVTYHITPTNSGCAGTPSNVKVAVYPIPDSWSVPASLSVCGGNQTLLNLFSHVANATFTWTATCPSPNIGGYGPGSGLSITQTLTNSGLTNEVVTYTVTPSANGCTGSGTTTILVTVKPSPVMTGPTRYTLCSGGMTNIVLQSNPSPATFTWTASGSSPNVTGYSASSGGSIAQTLVNSGFNLETVTYSVTPTAFGCQGPATNIIDTVFPVANVLFNPNGQTICSGTAPSIALSSGVTGASYTWNAAGSSGNINGFGPGVGTPINQVLNNTGLGIESATYSVMPTAHGCLGTPNSVMVSVKPLAAVSFTPCTDVITTTDANPFTLKGGLPLGGTYSGTGVNAGLFNPAAGAGTHVITYSYINVFNCPNTASLNITVLNPSAFLCDDLFTDVRDNKQYPTIKLGAQCWMAANLDFGTQVQSTVMQRDNCVSEKYCFNEITTNCTTLGGLYQWDELMQFEDVQSIQGLCPPGWHVPSENEWNTLFLLYNSSGFAGAPLKFSGFSGFNAFLNGIRFDNRNWYFNSFATVLWSSTSHGPSKAWSHAMNTINPSVSFYPANRSNAFYVRCLKN
jgi:uncharacterized protein (TIGR02145 family)